MIRKIISLGILYLITSSVCTYAQNITGKVIDETDMPLAYTNVILQKADSTYIDGTMTDTTGVFVIALHPEAALIQVSFIGYETLYRPMDEISLIKMIPDTEILGNAVVRAVLPKTEIKGDAFLTKVENSVLAQTGSANDVLRRLPGLMEKDGGLEVIGKGAPLIYINGRQVRDMSELEYLNSSDIKNVEVVHNPGARYDATVKAVIRIHTIRKQGDGFSFDLRSSVYQSSNTDLVEAVNLNYRYKGLDIFASTSFNREASFQKSPIEQKLIGTQTLELDQRLDAFGVANTLTSALGVNYQFNEDHSIGARYRPNYLISAKVDNISTTTATLGGVLADEGKTYMEGTNDPNVQHQLNLYYNGTVGKMNIDFNADLLYDNTTENKSYNELSELQENRLMTTSNLISDRLYASKLILTYPVFKGSISAGTEYTYTYRKDDYLNPEGYIASSRTSLQEDNVNAFLEMRYPLKFGSVNAGIRYEHMAFDYYSNDEFQEDQSRKYNNFYPNLSFNALAGNVMLALSYSTKTQRPQYQQLSNTFYVDRYSMTMGNPYLKPETIHDISLATVWKYFQLSASYQIVDDAMVQYAGAMDGKENVIGIQYYNYQKPIQSLSGFLSVTPTISFWSPRLTAGFKKQWMTYECPTESFRMNRPIAIVNFGNAFQLPKGFLIDLNYQFRSKGDERIYRLLSTMHMVDVFIRKSFFNDTLSIELRGEDILGTVSEKVQLFTDTYELIQTNKADTQRFAVTLRYKFNSAASKYKGTGAGEQQKNRM